MAQDTPKSYKLPTPFDDGDLAPHNYAKGEPLRLNSLTREECYSTGAFSDDELDLVGKTLLRMGYSFRLCEAVVEECRHGRTEKWFRIYEVLYPVWKNKLSGDLPFNMGDPEYRSLYEWGMHEAFFAVTTALEGIRDGIKASG